MDRPPLFNDDDYRRLQLARQRLKGIPDLELLEKMKLNLDENTRRDLRIRYTELYGFIPASLARALERPLQTSRLFTPQTCGAETRI